MSSSEIRLTDADARAVYDGKYGNKPDLGWGPRLRLSFNYFSPDEYYEAMVGKLVSEGCNWAEVGCGRDVFPSNPDLANELASRAGKLLGIDPDPNVKENPFVTEYFHGAVEDYQNAEEFDLITLRMVAEHIENPESALGAMVRLMAPGSRLVIYTPNKWAPMSVLAKITPLSVHHFFKKILWNTDERDTFPVQYKMNTHRDLKRLAEGARLKEEFFAYLDDCRIFGGYKFLNRIELSIRTVFRKLGLPHPENCILAVYLKPAD